ncbi:MAG: hypothetical protein IT190_07170, partial [Microbacteriaceae bacterium]|nr:hypothetical protein [Microbacteriaceae bacterium]
MMTSKFLPLTLVGLLLSSGFARADSPAYIPVGQAKAKKTPVAMAPIQIQSPSSDAPGLIKTISTTFENDLAFMDLFRLLPPSTFIESAEQQKGLTPDKFRFADWNSIGAEILVKSGISTAGNNMTYEVYLYDVYRGKQLLAKKYVGTVSDVVVIAHTFANDFVKTLTGLPGIFLTKTAMSCDRTRKKEIYVMDFDGTNVKQITHHRSISFAPAWHPQGTKLAYSLYVR